MEEIEKPKPWNFEVENFTKRENELSKILVNIFFKIHIKLGPGLFESVYETVICYELDKLKISYTRQEVVPIIYDEVKLENGFRADIIVEDLLIIEIKSIASLNDVYFKQLLTYLRLREKKLGLLVNFNEAKIKNGIHRIVNDL